MFCSTKQKVSFVFMIIGWMFTIGVVGGVDNELISLKTGILLAVVGVAIIMMSWYMVIIEQKRYDGRIFLDNDDDETYNRK